MTAGIPTPYATLGAAFTTINTGVLHTGTITIDVCGDTNEAGSSRHAQCKWLRQCLLHIYHYFPCGRSGTNDYWCARSR